MWETNLVPDDDLLVDVAVPLLTAEAHAILGVLGANHLAIGEK